MRRMSYKFRLKPTAHQETLLRKTLELCRWTYNETLATRKKAWEGQKKSLSRFITINMLPQWKVAKPELKEVNSQVLQQVHERVDLAFRAFFRRVKAGENPGYPRFKGKGWYDSFTYPQGGRGAVLVEDGLKVDKIGLVRLAQDRELSAGAAIKRVTIKCEAGKWYAILNTGELGIHDRPHGRGTVGIDLGCKAFITLSDGNEVANPKFLCKAQKRLARANRRLAKRPKGTPERSRARKTLCHVYQKVNNQRNDFLHKTSRSLVSTYQTLVFEDLHIQQLVQQRPWHSLNRAILDSSWGRFVDMCSYKAENAGGKVLKVNPKNTTQACSRCGVLVPKGLDERIHACPTCGLTIGRDLNAAINILRRSQASLVRAQALT